MKLKLILFCTLCTVSLAACQNISFSSAKQESSSAASEAEQSSATQKEEKTSSADSQAETADETNTSVDTAPTVVDFQNILDLMGKKDAEVVSVLGEGTPMILDDSTLINRDYTLFLFDENVTATMHFNLYQEGSDKLEQCTINLTERKLEDYEKLLEEILGKPTETYEKSYFFSDETSDIVLANPYDDEPYIEITLKDLATE